MQSEEDRSSVAGASELDEAIVTTVTTDFRRGKRFKKLIRLLSGAMTQRTMQRFYQHTLGVVICLGLIHVVIFIIMYLLLAKQQYLVHELNVAGAYRGARLAAFSV